ncbi:MAG: hypothetical protein ACI8XB_002211 [Patiriisocius sp.]
MNGVVFESAEEWINGNYEVNNDGYFISVSGRMFTPMDTFMVGAGFESENLLDYFDGGEFIDTNPYNDRRFSSGFIYIGGDGSVYIDANSSTSEGSGSAVAIDAISQTISGTFSFLYDNGDDNTIHISSGYFTNVPYE